MTIVFQARDIHLEETDEHLLVGLASGGLAPDHYVILSRGLVGGEGVADEVVAKPYFEYCDETQTGYGCIERVTLRPDRLALRIDRALCPDVADVDIQVELVEPRPDLPRLAKLIERIMEGSGRVRVAID